MKYEVLRVAIGAAILAISASGVAGQTVSPIVVHAGDNLQTALNQAQPGQTIEVQAGATFDGNFILPAKTGAGFITVRTSTPDAQLPGPGTRIDAAQEPLLPTVRSLNGIPALRTAAGAHHWRLLGLRFTTTGASDVIVLGDGTQRDRNLVPSDLVLDRIVIRGDATKGNKRGIALNSANTQVVNSYITGIRLLGQESQGIACWNGPGPFLIENNYIEAGSIGVLFGGSPPAIDQLVPSDIVVRRNHITRPVSLRGGGWGVKNLFELKNARNVQIDGNLFENNWADGQSGFPIVFTVRANGNAPWTVIEHVRFENNIVRHSGSAVNVLGYDDVYPSQQLHDLVIRNNLFTDVDSAAWGGSGIFLQIGSRPADVHVEHNTVIQSGNIISAWGGTATAAQAMTGFRFASNIVRHNTYGIYGDNFGMGNAAIAAYFPGSTITGNVMAGGNANQYPADNVFPTLATLLAQFENAAAGDYRLIATSSLRSMAQGVPGVEFGELDRAMNGPTVPPPSAPTGLRVVN